MDDFNINLESKFEKNKTGIMTKNEADLEKNSLSHYYDGSKNMNRDRIDEFKKDCDKKCFSKFKSNYQSEITNNLFGNNVNETKQNSDYVKMKY